MPWPGKKVVGPITPTAPITTETLPSFPTGKEDEHTFEYDLYGRVIRMDNMPVPIRQEHAINAMPPEIILDPSKKLEQFTSVSPGKRKYTYKPKGIRAIKREQRLAEQSAMEVTKKHPGNMNAKERAGFLRRMRESSLYDEAIALRQGCMQFSLGIGNSRVSCNCFKVRDAAGFFAHAIAVRLHGRPAYVRKLRECRNDRLDQKKNKQKAGFVEYSFISGSGLKPAHGQQTGPRSYYEQYHVIAIHLDKEDSDPGMTTLEYMNIGAID